jgi:diguanylate cyclase (GGDEF)-like protein
MRQRRQLIVRAPKQSNLTQVTVLQHLSQALAAAQPLTEIGLMLACDLQAALGLHDMVLATYAEAENTLHFRMVVRNQTVEQWPAATASVHPLVEIVWRRKAAIIPATTPTKQAWFALPMIFAGSVVGVLAVGDAHRALQYQAILETCAGLLATSVYTLEQFQSLERTFAEQADTLAGISEIARQLNATLDVQQIVDLVLTYALGTGEKLNGVVLLLNGAKTLQVQAHHGSAQAIAAGCQLFVNGRGDIADFGLDRDYLIQPVDAFPPQVRFRERGCQAVFPLRHEDRLLGVLVLSAESSQSFGPIQVRFLHQLTAHGGLALSNAYAYTKIAQQHDLLDQRLAQLQAVSRISQAISAHLNLEALLPEIVEVVRSTLGYRSALLSLVDTDDPNSVRRVAAVGLPDVGWDMLSKQVIPLSHYKMLMAEDFRIGRSYYIPHDHAAIDQIDQQQLFARSYRPEIDERAPHEWHPDDVLLVPLYGHRGGLVGILSVDDPADGQRPIPETITVLEIFATQAATAIENARLYAEMERQALTDNLTGLANQRHFMMHLAQHIAWSEREHHGLTVLALDIDHFKSYNDNFGHLAGNVVLRQFANVVRQTVRSSDLVARWGGEEFFALLPHSTLEGALEVAERIRNAVKNHPFPHRQISVSIGVATFIPGMADQDLLVATDEALYRAKITRDTVST